MTDTSSSMQRYVVLPSYGLRSERLSALSSLTPNLPLNDLPTRSGSGFTGSEDSINILDSVSKDGPRLVEMTPEAELELRRQEPDLKIVPVVKYHTMRLFYDIKQTPAQPAALNVDISRFRIVAPDGTPLPGAAVIAFTNFSKRIGYRAVSDSNGEGAIPVAPATVFDRLYLYAPAGFWGRYAESFSFSTEPTITLRPIDLLDPNLALNRFRARLPQDAGQGVVVGIVDTGVARHHPALPNVTGGVNMVFDETKNDPGLTDDWGPARIEGEHGTHVAGIVGANPTDTSGIRGVAPGVTLRSYRVFPHAGGGAANYDIMNAIDRAVQDGCHIVNLSLGGGSEDEAVRAAIGAALDRGVIVIAAAGNDFRKAVSFPAALPFCTAVSAMGWKGTFPENAVEKGDIAGPYGQTDDNAFVGAFSNIGPQIDLTGPGVGIVSTLPDKDYGSMSGTSMACPAVAGFVAFLLASEPHILNDQSGNRNRSVLDRLYNSAARLGFGRDYEGFGLPG